MALNDLLNLSQAKKIGVSEERVEPIVPIMSKYIAFWRAYPDLFIDFLQVGSEGGEVPKEGFHFYFYQRVFLRACLRQRYTYFVFTRGYSKSFLVVLSLIIKCILQPGIKLFVTSGGKEQSAGIIKDKVDELCTLIPALAREIDWRPGKTRVGKDKVIYLFKNGSWFDNVPASERSRGMRRQGGIMEECVGIDGNILSQVIIPMMNVSRRAPDGLRHEEEPTNKFQTYVTTAGYKATFSYFKLIQYLIWMAVDPGKAFILGGSWRIPVVSGLADRNQINDLKRDETFDQTTFEREYKTLLYSLNFVNCWKAVKINKLQHRHEIKSSVNV